jgi:hypothetical protein
VLASSGGGLDVILRRGLVVARYLVHDPAQEALPFLLVLAVGAALHVIDVRSRCRGGGGVLRFLVAAGQLLLETLLLPLDHLAVVVDHLLFLVARLYTRAIKVIKIKVT